MRATTVAAVALALALASCGPVRRVYLRPDYREVDQKQVKRLVVITAPPPNGSDKLGELWALLARRYVNQKRNFIAKAHRTAGAPLPVREVCGEGLEGVLFLAPVAEPKGKGVEATVTARLLRCSDGERVWEAEAGGSFLQDDPHLRETAAQYVAELGPEVAPHVPAAFKLLKATLDELPNPLLNEQDVEEKIELGE